MKLENVLVSKVSFLGFLCFEFYTTGFVAEMNHVSWLKLTSLPQVFLSHAGIADCMLIDEEGVRVMSCTNQLGRLMQWHRCPDPTRPEDTLCAQGPSDSTLPPYIYIMCIL